MPATKPFWLMTVVLLCMAYGCTTTSGGARLRPDGTPDPQECPDEAKRAMKLLKLRVGADAWVDLDANQIDSSPITLYDGPIESLLREDFGTLEATTRLYGQVWTGGPQVVIRYYGAHLPDSETGSERIPICAVARLSDNNLRKRPESKPGTAILDTSVAGAAIVDAFR